MREYKKALADFHRVDVSLRGPFQLFAGFAMDLKGTKAKDLVQVFLSPCFSTYLDKQGSRRVLPKVNVRKTVYRKNTTDGLCVSISDRIISGYGRS